VPLTIGILVLSVAAYAGPSTSAAASGKSKPECAVRSAGKMWPDEANRDTKALRSAAQTGELELCGKRRDGYRWESVSVNVRQLRTEQSPLANGFIDRQYPSAPDTSSSLADSPDADDGGSGNNAPSESAGASRHQRGFFQAIRRVLGIRQNPVP